MQPIFLTPVFKQTIWGGNRLCRDFNYDVSGENIGECWAISSHPDGDCTVADGEFAGKTLGALWRERRDLFGNYPGKRFPLLVKIIDAASDLSIQVHPDDDYAREHENGASGKSECWYILDCPDDAEIVIGHNARDHQEMEDMIRSHRWSEFVRTIPVHKGDFFQIDPGTLHAIKGGTLLLETQENSDITYRVYDYDRLSDGKPRELHLEKSIDVITAPYVPVAPGHRAEHTADYKLENLITHQYYRVDKLTLHGTFARTQDMPFLNISVIEGSGAIDDYPIRKGTHLILPSGYGTYRVTGDLTLISSCVAPT